MGQAAAWRLTRPRPMQRRSPRARSLRDASSGWRARGIRRPRPRGRARPPLRRQGGGQGPRVLPDSAPHRRRARRPALHAPAWQAFIVGSLFGWKGRDASGASASRTSRRPRIGQDAPARGHWTLRARLRRRAGGAGLPRPPRASRPGSSSWMPSTWPKIRPASRVLTIVSTTSRMRLRRPTCGRGARGPEPRRQARPHGAHRRDS